jgi:hypothetical protein
MEPTVVTPTRKGVRQGCPLSPTMFNLRIDKTITKWQIELKSKFYINNFEFNTFLFSYEQEIIVNPEHNLQKR